ncbi:YqcC family protein [Chromohalobacter beijerinckii]|uniref:YqcC family protein n=1 Tax=Chromohalobacter beijerinckii TaxID=86179 RepID=A0ABV8XL77_9GAMM|nr:MULTISPECIES: YqcC family protein [Chromohalobacter]MCK0764439.1 YqcC family protein [Chromohalobacter beijerinckii]MCK2041782.1 YqcC family protein [Chromohalobacter moromii]MCT8513930.1 YqcC family protein [Chromohalobacter sp. TMW 2.2271]
MTAHDDLMKALENLVATLRSVDMWRVEEPTAAAFASQQPFCVDTMVMPQWLRYVFVARLETLVETESPLPASCDVAPAVDTWLKDASPSVRRVVTEAVAEVDRVVTEA